MAEAPDERLVAVARAAWRSMSVYHVRGYNTSAFLEARGWVRQERGRWKSPYNGELLPGASAIHVERNVAREELVKVLALAGYPLLTGGPYRRISKADLESAAKGL